MVIMVSYDEQMMAFKLSLAEHHFFSTLYK